MEASLTAAWNPPPVSIRCSVENPKIPRCPVRHRWSMFSRPKNRQLFISCSIKLPLAENFGDLNKAKTNLCKISESLSKPLPEHVKEFPWKKAEDMVLQRLFFLGQEALKWSLAAFVITSSISDVFFSFSRNRELMFPLGLFVGLTVAEFMKETSQELFQGNKKVWGIDRRLLSIGFVFVVIKFLLLYATIPGKIILSHVCNGGLMQVLWLAKNIAETQDLKGEA